ncbi:MAG: type II toxin-antitoxin system HicB family antitoxin [Pirellulales bacterium]|nr:type II toxin-antitoxin system HicB family antitoxin [Pirellulales bacterium]
MVIERTVSNFSAYVPVLLGCVASGTTLHETEQLLREAIVLHLQGLEADGLPVPQPSSVVDYVELPVGS